MKLYDGGRAPNPRRVRVFLAEKGITVPTEQVDLGQLQQRSAISKCCIPIRRYSAAAHSRARWSKCGAGA
jgi:hypothetical protein